MKTNFKNKGKGPLKLLGTALAAALIVFGASSCNRDTTANNTADAYGTERVANRTVSYFDEWDANADNQLDRAELNVRMSDNEAYGNWINQQGQITQNEFNQGNFNRWDADRDGYLSADEYSAGNAYWEPQYGNNFTVWDRNRDTMVDAEEYGLGMNETGIFNEWDMDRDGTINDIEFRDGTFNTWDRNRDGFLDTNEFDNTTYDNWSGTRLK